MNAELFNKEGIASYIDLKKYGISAFGLKIIALITMIVDHVACIFVKNKMLFQAMRGVGRLSFPLYAFLIVEGFINTSNRIKYAIRLLVFAVISEVPYDMVFGGAFVNMSKSNVFFTLLLGLLAVWGMEIASENKMVFFKKSAKNCSKNGAQLIMNVLSVGIPCCVAHIVNSSYSYAGVLLIVCFYVFRKYYIGKLVSNLFFNIGMFGGIQWAGSFAIIPIIFYNGLSGNKRFKWLFYMVYPVHLIAIVVIYHIIY